MNGHVASTAPTANPVYDFSGHVAFVTGASSGTVADEQQVAGAATRTVETFGRLDLAYNNAGIQSPMTDAADKTAETFGRVNGMNLRGIWASMKHELAQMRTQGSGAIVNCSSLGGLVGLPRGMRINAICPGAIGTRWSPR
jgi:NAD(P)-dependent dehydrogenase (short-subunit alcohol dehydrogenase family)